MDDVGNPRGNPRGGAALGTVPFVVLWPVGLTGTPTVTVFYCLAALPFTLGGVLAVRETARQPLPET